VLLTAPTSQRELRMETNARKLTARGTGLVSVRFPAGSRSDLPTVIESLDDGDSRTLGPGRVRTVHRTLALMIFPDRICTMTDEGSSRGLVPENQRRTTHRKRTKGEQNRRVIGLRSLTPESGAANYSPPSLWSRLFFSPIMRNT
jgi:hypothetical protein